MEFKKLIFSILRKSWIIFIVVVIAASGTFYFCRYVMKPVYESHVKFYVMRTEGLDVKALNYDDIMVSMQLMNNYVEMITSRTFVSVIIQELGITNISEEEFSSKIKVKLIGDTNIMDISVSDNSAALAQKYAEFTGKAFVQKVQDLTKENSITYVDEANLPSAPIKPNISLYVALSIILSLITSISTIIILDLFDDTIKTGADVELQYDLKVLGTIPFVNIRQKWNKG